jgi:hypothetical protein
MGYTTDFIGHIDISPPLNDAEQAYLKAYAASPRTGTEQTPYVVPGNPAASGSRDALLCPGPLRTGRARFPGIRLKQAPWATKGFCVGVMAGGLGWW